MEIDKFHRQIFTENDICHIYMADHSIDISDMYTNSTLEFNDELELSTIPKVSVVPDIESSVDEFHQHNQQLWHMPDFYQSIDVVQFVLDKCILDSEIERAGQELIKYQERDLFPLLRYLIYLVDTMRAHNIVWGVGRGSSVSSYVLFLIGIHKIDSIRYNLSYEEFFK